METLVKLLQSFWNALQSGQLPHLGGWNYIILAGLVAVEGPVATVMGGVAASTGYMQAGWVFTAAACGNLTADMGWYALGRMVKTDWLPAHETGYLARRLGLSRQVLTRLRGEISAHAPKILVLAKLTAALTIPSLIVAGLTRTPVRRWVLPYLAAEAVWTGGLTLVGFYTTQAVTQLEQDLQVLTLAGTLVLLGLLIWLGRRFLRKLVVASNFPRQYPPTRED